MLSLPAPGASPTSKVITFHPPSILFMIFPHFSSGNQGHLGPKVMQKRDPVYSKSIWGHYFSPAGATLHHFHTLFFGKSIPKVMQKRGTWNSKSRFVTCCSRGHERCETTLLFTTFAARPATRRVTKKIMIFHLRPTTKGVRG